MFSHCTAPTLTRAEINQRGDAAYGQTQTAKDKRTRVATDEGARRRNTAAKGPRHFDTPNAKGHATSTSSSSLQRGVAQGEFIIIRCIVLLLCVQLLKDVGKVLSNVNAQLFVVYCTA